MNDVKNMSGAVDIDAVVNLTLQKFKRLLGVTQDYVKDIFKSCDVRNLLSKCHSSTGITTSTWTSSCCFPAVSSPSASPATRPSASLTSCRTKSSVSRGRNV